MPRETQISVADWALGAFGRAPTTLRIAGRANEEMAELLEAALGTMVGRRRYLEVVEEAADVVIVLWQVASRLTRGAAIPRPSPWDDLGTPGAHPLIQIGNASNAMAKLLRALTIDDLSPDALRYVEQVIRTLYALAARLGYNLDSAIDAKMSVNRARVWQVAGDGTAQHVRQR